MICPWQRHRRRQCLHKREREREREVRWKDIWIGIERDLKRDLDGVKVRDVRNFEKEEED